ncbi:aldehyde dehydrogenase family protein, partial [Streptomyces sp. NPDC004561]
MAPRRRRPWYRTRVYRLTRTALVTHPGVDKVTFTGSTAAGRRVASLCGNDLK